MYRSKPGRVRETLAELHARIRGPKGPAPARPRKVKTYWTLPGTGLHDMPKETLEPGTCNGCCSSGHPTRAEALLCLARCHERTAEEYADSAKALRRSVQDK